MNRYTRPYSSWRKETIATRLLAKPTHVPALQVTGTLLARAAKGRERAAPRIPRRTKIWAVCVAIVV